MTTKETAIQLTRANLYSIFGETNPSTRLSKIAQLWVPDTEVLFIDPLGVFNTHQGISDMVAKLQDMGPGQVFTELSEVDVLSPSTDQDLWVTRLKWGAGPPGGEPVLTGEDVMTIVGGKIKTLYTFLGGKA
ncbi:hypothetical protein P154DRAFT_592409 [Amniculicola lignicola CBS 123094]|uniref:SnoaL-like domain-containing protein n=1 Tax=Amniculicola lignicola CBS 123094 TaxID=1392246 RepID=A0A6A5X308_9PLEO|nr:hypothetical protein P154DRAFT_592409 [Amniculicola lignicola CBS 123094]